MPCRRLWQLIVLYGAAAALGCALLSPGAGAQDRPDEPERQDKAAFLYKFGSYVTWPDGAFAHPDSPFVIGIAGADELADQLARLVSGRTIGNRPVSVRRIPRAGAMKGLHMLFVGNGTGTRAADFYQAVQGRPILVVTETAGNWPQSSAINLVIDDNRVRFDVAVDAAARNGLKVSALLLSAARQVRGR